MAELKTIDDLKPDPGNPREIEEPAAAGLRMSLQSFGDIGGLTYNKQTGELVSGHQRVEQLRRAGAKLEPGDTPHLLLGEYRWPVRVVDWSRERQRTANLAANNPATSGEFTPDVGDILAELEEVVDEDMFTGLRLGDIEIPEMKDARADQDEVPEPTKEPVTRLGDVWELGRHRVMCGDCSEVQVSQLFELLVTDPPYGVDYSAKNAFLNKQDGGNRIERDIENDTHTPDEMYTLWLRWFSAIHKFAKPGASYYVTGPGDNLLLLLLLLLALRESGFTLRQMLIWAKNNHVLGRRDFHGKHEPILFGWTEGARHRFHGGDGCFSLWEVDRPHQSKLHPTMKPVALFAKAIGHSSKPGELVCDPFLGSGTTLIAAEQLGRVCHGIELDPRYVDVCVERWENLTHGKAKKICS